MAYLRVILVLVNGIYEEEALLDNGFQIVSISRAITIASKIIWDLILSIQMQNMNGSLLQICVLVKNMLFILEKVTGLLQIHIIKKTLYQTLLKRFFDAITKSWVVNNKEENQTINITYLNIEMNIMLPTYKRGILSRRIDMASNFH